jgi:hypothetical protein
LRLAGTHMRQNQLKYPQTVPGVSKPLPYSGTKVWPKPSHDRWLRVLPSSGPGGTLPETNLRGILELHVSRYRFCNNAESSHSFTKVVWFEILMPVLCQIQDNSFFRCPRAFGSMTAVLVRKSSSVSCRNSFSRFSWGSPRRLNAWRACR